MSFESIFAWITLKSNKFIGCTNIVASDWAHDFLNLYWYFSLKERELDKKRVVSENNAFQWEKTFQFGTGKKFSWRTRPLLLTIERKIPLLLLKQVN